MSIRRYFQFSKRERTGIIALTVLAVVFGLFPRFGPQEDPVPSAVKADALGALLLKQQRQYDGRTRERKSRDSPYTKAYSYARTPYTGHAKKDDKRNFQKRYHERDVGAREMGRKDEPSKSAFVRNEPWFKNKSYHKVSLRPVEINSADTAGLIALPGIGSKLAARIVAFRDKLGGFYTVEQLSEVYGLADSVFKRIRPLLKCDTALVRRININTAPADTLRMHPYIRSSIAGALVAYRNMHGDFGSAKQLANINSIDAGALNKMMPYLTVQ